MKNCYIGLGILTLIFSLSLFIPGIEEAQKVSHETFFSAPESSLSEDHFHSAEIVFHDGVFKSRTETSETHHLIRKYPATFGLLFLFFHGKRSQGQELLYVVGQSYFPVKDLPLSYRNLRI